MVRRSFKFIKDNMTAVLFGIFIILLSINLIIHFYNVDPTGSHFNNWLSPVINLGGFIAVIVTIVISRNEIINRSSQPFYEYHLKVIGETVDRERAIKDKNLLKFFQTEPKFKDRNIDLINFGSGYRWLYVTLKVDFKLGIDIKLLQNVENLNLDTFKSKDYHRYIFYLKIFQTEITLFYSYSLEYILENILSDKRLSNESKDLLYRHINRYIIRDYIQLCTLMGDLEFYTFQNDIPIFKKFKSEDLLHLFTFMKSVPELKGAFIPEKYWDKSK